MDARYTEGGDNITVSYDSHMWEGPRAAASQFPINPPKYEPRSNKSNPPTTSKLQGVLVLSMELVKKQLSFSLD